MPGGAATLIPTDAIRANVGLVRRFSAASKIVTPAEHVDAGPPLISKPLYVACALFFGTYLSYFMIPLVGHGTAKHAVELAKKSTDPMLQKSAADRIAILSGTDSTAEVMVKVGAVGALLGLLASSSDANVLGSTVCALAVLSKCDSGKAELVTGASKAALQQALRAVEESAVREKLAALIKL